MKRPRIPSRPSDQTSFGLLAWLEETRVSLPLKGVECRFEVTGTIASVELDQIYHQSASRPLDCTYTFPLPAGAAVHRCEVHINGRIIRAKVEDRRTAKDIYSKRKAEGLRVALVETERENLFTLLLGNVQPDDMIVVCFAWFQVLDRARDGLRLLVPTCPGVRYIPGKPLLRSPSGRGTADDTDQVPDASRITPPRIDALHPDAAYFSVKGRLSATDVESGTASSPSHPIHIREANGAVTVELSRRSAVPDRDFVLVWQEPTVLQLAPQCWQWTERGVTYALVQIRAPEAVKVARNFPQDFYFLVDRSASMVGAKWQKSCEALRAFVGLLGPEDRVWITLFESHFRDFDDAPMAAPEVLADAGFGRIEKIGTAGGTEMLPAAIHVLGKIATHSTGRHTSLILITDGQVGNEDAVTKAFKPATNVRVHTFGIDTAVNDAFLKSLARQQRGGCWLQTPDDDIAGTVSALGDRLRRPVLRDLAVAGSWETGSGALPDIHAGEVVTEALRGKAAKEVKITGRLPDDTARSFTVTLGAEGSEALKLVWAQQRIAALLETGRPDHAIAMAKKHNLICRGAAFIAWDEAEEVQIAEEEIVEPVFFARRITSAFRAMPLNACFPPRPAVPDHDAPQSMEGAGHRTHGAPREILRRGPGTKANAQSQREEKARRKALIAGQIGVLRNTLLQAGVEEANIDRFRAWVEAADTLERIAAVTGVVQMIALARSELGALDGLDRGIRAVLNGRPKALLKWAEEFRQILNALLDLRRRLEQVENGRALFEQLAGWAAESGRLQLRRLQTISAFFEALKDGPFSMRSAERRLRQFLDETVGASTNQTFTRFSEIIEAIGPRMSVPGCKIHV